MPVFPELLCKDISNISCEKFYFWSEKVARGLAFLTPLSSISRQTHPRNPLSAKQRGGSSLICWILCNKLRLWSPLSNFREGKGVSLVFKRKPCFIVKLKPKTMSRIPRLILRLYFGLWNMARIKCRIIISLIKNYYTNGQNPLWTAIFRLPDAL